MKKTTSNKRNIGIELLRSVSIIFAITLHVLNAGGIVDTADRATYYSKLAYTLFIIAFCGVDCFALISGYVGYKSKVKPSRIIRLWLIAFLYSAVITVIFAIIKPETVDSQIWFNALTPITSGQWWYLTAYFGMMILAPFLNKGIQVLTFKAYSVIMIVMFVFVITIPCLLGSDPYMMASGYSAIWLCFLYIAGGYFAKFEIEKTFKKNQLFIIFAISAFITFIAYRRRFENLISYTSPTIFICAVCLLLFCVKLKFNSDSVLSKIILFAAPSALCVYLIHVHPLIYQYVISGCGKRCFEYGYIGFVLSIIAIVLIIYIVCLAADMPRRLLFKLLKIDEKLSWFDNPLH